MADDGEPDLNRARICIDFGTALSKASVCVDPLLPLEVGVRPLPIGTVSGAEHPLLTPSILLVDRGRMYFGPTAFEHARMGGGDPLLSFKTVLGARNIEEALNSKLRQTIDPTGTFRQRDALVLYLAHLDQLIREAIKLPLNLPPSVVNAKRRYTSPAWKPGDGSDRAFEAIFNEAAAVSQKLGRLLLGEDGISIAQCKDALDKAAAAPLDSRLETGVFEPHAAAAASLAFSTEPTRFVVVFDVGAGTTDIAAFEFDERTDPPSLGEIKEARQCSGLAGDEIDRILIEMFWRKRGANRSRDDEMTALRTTKLLARELKQQLFATGRCSLKNGMFATTVTIEELAEEPKFREYQTALGRTLAASLQVVTARAEAAGAPFIDVVLAGGGSNLPFLPELTRIAGAGRKVNLRIAPLSPDSALYAGVDPALGGAFPQIAMSVGGALVEMMPRA
ncbi:MAG: Hsp70 family protein [Hyphomonadaceae bacterium]